MALNNLNGVLNNIVNDVAPIIMLSNGLYTVVDKKTIVPKQTLGTNLIGEVIEECITTDNIIVYFELLGNWDASYKFDIDTGKWTKIQK